MKSLWKCLIQSTLVFAAIVGTTATLVAQDDQPAGVFRISSRPVATDAGSGPLVQTGAMMADASCQKSTGTNPAMSGTGGDFGEMCDGNCRHCRRHFGRHSHFGGGQSGDCWGDGYGMGHGHGMGYGHGGCRGNCNGALAAYLRCKFGYFIPTGGGGQGIPWAGHYARVYPVNPYYNDPRSGQAWAAQGYGVPVSVPLAPVVGHTFEYGWGVPSSRLTPVSHPAY